MTAIIIEGPDESGKTTLATALLGYYGEEASILKSPAGKTEDWYPYFEAWAGRVTMDSRTTFQILDRIPEISETVYGPIMRKYSRLNNSMASILNLPKSSTVIFCQFPLTRPRGDLYEDHKAVGGHVISNEDQLAIIGGYKVVEFLVKESGVRTLSWYYWRSNETWLSLLTQLGLPPNDPPSFEVALERGKERLSEPV